MTRKRKEFTEADVLGALGAARQPMSLRELAAALEAHGRERHELKKLVKRLEQRGRVAEVHGGRYLTADKVQAKPAHGRHAKADLSNPLPAPQKSAGPAGRRAPTKGPPPRPPPGARAGGGRPAAGGRRPPAKTSSPG